MDSLTLAGTAEESIITEASDTHQVFVLGCMKSHDKANLISIAPFAYWVG